MNLQEVQQLKQNIDNANNRLLVVKTQIEGAKQRQAEILKEYNCNNIEELQKLKEDREAEMDKLIQQANQYLNTVLPIISEVEKVTTVI